MLSTIIHSISDFHHSSIIHLLKVYKIILFATRTFSTFYRFSAKYIKGKILKILFHPEYCPDCLHSIPYFRQALIMAYHIKKLHLSLLPSLHFPGICQTFCVIPFSILNQRILSNYPLRYIYILFYNHTLRTPTEAALTIHGNQNGAKKASPEK